MWTRKDLKEKAKVRFKANYWWSVLAAIILTAILGGAFTISDRIDTGDIKKALRGTPIYKQELQSELEDAKEDIEDAKEDIKDAIKDITEDEDINIVINGKEIDTVIDDFVDNIEDNMEAKDPQEIAKDVMPLAFPIVIVAFVLVSIISVFGIAFGILVRNPFEVGGRKFFAVNHTENGKINNFCFGFKNNYKNIIKTMFLRDLYIFLWSLLFVIPGIIKAYEYKMIPYLLSEDPNMDTQAAFDRSKQMMTGNKWKAFVLDLSFIGWHMLSGLTLGMLGIFYVGPYMFQTDAELYFALKDGNDCPTMDNTTDYASYVEVE